MTAYVAKGELREVCLEIIVATHDSIGGHDKQFLVFRPAESSYGAFVPLGMSGNVGFRRSKVHTLIFRINLPAQLYKSILGLESLELL